MDVEYRVNRNSMNYHKKSQALVYIPCNWFGHPCCRRIILVTFSHFFLRSVHFTIFALFSETDFLCITEYQKLGTVIQVEIESSKVVEGPNRIYNTR